MTEVVSLDGDLYVVDLKTHRIRRIDEGLLIETETTIEAESEVEAAED